MTHDSDSSGLPRILPVEEKKMDSPRETTVAHLQVVLSGSGNSSLINLKRKSFEMPKVALTSLNFSVSMTISSFSGHPYSAVEIARNPEVDIAWRCGIMEREE
ncbi:hypothetical protein NPIL_392751 [Nephila pilipes]|uniref:Uncharacterized protein n=1 Tax=Nephila pilipes TaxID=299642 RepID=A0A8X6UHR8_NEPPI|nr:hypothetical protein NPIL_392751 [Nephila pilipes]